MEENAQPSLLDALLEVGSVYRTKEEAEAMIKAALTPYFDATANVLMECQRIRYDAAVVMDNPTLEHKAMCSRTIERLREKHIVLERLMAQAGW